MKDYVHREAMKPPEPIKPMNTTEFSDTLRVKVTIVTADGGDAAHIMSGIKGAVYGHQVSGRGRLSSPVRFDFGDEGALYVKASAKKAYDSAIYDMACALVLGKIERITVFRNAEKGVSVVAS